MNTFLNEYGYGLGRKYSEDERDKRFPAARALRALAKKPRARRWRRGPTLDQGHTGACVGHAGAAWYLAAPIMRGSPPPFYLYRECVLLDPWPDNDGEAGAADRWLQFGTDVRSLAKAIVARGDAQQYVWAFNAETVANFVLTEGTVVLGTDWHEDMFYPDKKGLVNISGPIVGGHAYLCLWYYIEKDLFACVNSWGTDWGQDGVFYVRRRDMSRLIGAHGEALCMLQTKVLPAKGV